jgi:NAD(P)-dependent dehydrogenase (short-subunit alcohol dehydrogenase family)
MPPTTGLTTPVKAGVASLARTLRLELRPQGVEVGIAYLAYVDTTTARAAVESPLMSGILARMPGGVPKPMPVDDVARSFVSAIERRSRRIVQPRSGVTAVYFPELVQAIIDRRLGKTAAEESG